MKRTLIPTSFPAVWAVASAAALACAPAWAASPTNSKSPIDISADQVEIHNNDCTYVYTGQAEALQDTSRLRSDIMIGHLELKKGQAGAKSATPQSSADAAASTCGDLTTLEAKGHVYYADSTFGRRVHGDNGFYDAATTTITITGDVTAVDGQNVMRGTKMVYNTQTGEGHVEGAARGAGAKNRPRGVFYPKDSDANAPAGAAPAADAPAKSKKPGK